MSRPGPAWTDQGALRAQVQRLWDRGSLLSSQIDGGREFPRRLSFKTPGSRALSEQFGQVREWMGSLQDIRGIRIEYRSVRHRILGENRVPVAAWLDSPQQGIALLGKARDARRFGELLAQTRQRHPDLVAWLQRYPLRALAMAADWSKVLDFIDWLLAHPRPDVYLRQVDVPEIDSKFLERHRGLLASLLDRVLADAQIDHSATGASGFLRRYGFRAKPRLLRFRLLDPGLAPLPGRDSDITLTAADFRDLEQHSAMRARIQRVFITENEINFLAFPPVAASLVIFGAGYGFDALADVPWLAGLQVHYWGDIDSHGFAILDQLRAVLPQSRNLLMDEATLLAHRSFWGQEPRPERRLLQRLDTSEQRLYQDLCDNRFAQSLRLEQERVGFHCLLQALRQLA